MLDILVMQSVVAMVIMEGVSKDYLLEGAMLHSLSWSLLKSKCKQYLCMCTEFFTCNHNQFSVAALAMHTVLNVIPN